MNVLPPWAQTVARELAQNMPPPSDGEYELGIGGSAAEWISGEIHATPDTGRPMTILVCRMRMGQRGPGGETQQVWSHQTITSPQAGISLRGLTFLKMIGLAVWAEEAECPGSRIAHDLLMVPPYVAPGVFADACRIALSDLTQSAVRDAIETHRRGVAIAGERMDPTWLVFQALRPAVKRALSEALNVDSVVTSLLVGWLDDRPPLPS